MTPKVAPVVTVAVWFSVIRLLAAKTSPTPPIIAKANGITKRLAIFKVFQIPWDIGGCSNLKTFKITARFASTVFSPESIDIRAGLRHGKLFALGARFLQVLNAGL
jgi:hypothetical protein